MMSCRAMFVWFMLGFAGGPFGLARATTQVRQPIYVDYAALADNADLPLVVKRGGAFGNVLAMNVRYKPVTEVRQQLEAALGKTLDYFRGWHAQGEAHVTIVTPPEYHDVLQDYMPMGEIAALAENANIQQAQLQVHGLGSGRLANDGKDEETFFYYSGCGRAAAVAASHPQEIRRQWR